MKVQLELEKVLLKLAKEQLELVRNFETQKHYQNKPKFNDINSRINLPKITDGPEAINLNEYELIENYLIAFCVCGNNVAFFDGFGVVHVPKEIKKIIGNKNITINI